MKTMKLVFSCATMFMASMAVFAQTQLGDNIEAIDTGSEFGEAVACSGNGERVAVGAPNNDQLATNGGIVRVFEWVDTSWVQVGQNLLGADFSFNLGTAVALNQNGNILAIGSKRSANPWTGHAMIYGYDGAQWVQLGDTLVDNTMSSHFGAQIALNSNGNTVLIGTEGAYAKAYEWNSVTQNWENKGTIPGNPGNCGGEDGTGESIDISADGNIIIVGSPDFDANNDCFDNRGMARVYTWNGSDWDQLGGTIFGEPNHRLGSSVSINNAGNRIAIGGPEPQTGSQNGLVRTFDWDPNFQNWIEIGTPVIGDLQDQLGSAISLNARGNIMLVGAIEDLSNEPGFVRRYELVNGLWIQSGSDVIGPYTSNTGTGRVGSLQIDSCGMRSFIGSRRASSIANGITRAFHYCDPMSSTIDTLSCGPIMINDSLYEGTGQYTQTIIDGCGCDSVLTINLQIDELIDTVVFDQDLWTLNALQDSVEYQWLYCGTGDTLSGATDQSYSPIADGSYAAVLQSANCTIQTQCIDVIGTGINESRSMNFSIRPNPGNGSFEVFFNEVPAQKLNVEVFNLVGEVVHTEQSSVSNERIRLELGHLAKGMYLVKVRSESTTSTNNRATRLIVQ